MTDSQQGLPFPRRVIAIFAISLGSMLQQIDVSIAGILLPTISKALHVDSASSVLVVTVYQLVLAMTLLPFAALGDRIGHRRQYQAGLMLHIIAAIFCFFANSLPALIAVRALQGLATAAMMSIAIGMLRSIYPLERLGAGLSLNTVSNVTGTTLAPVIGGFILSVTSWHWGFVAVVPFSIISLFLSRALPDPVPRKHRFDLLGAALCALTFGLVISGLEGAIHSSHLLLSMAVIALGVAVGWFFIRHEARVAEPVLPVDLLKLPVISLPLLSCFAAILGSSALLLFMPFRLQHGYGFSPGEIGGIMAAYAVIVAVVSPTAGYLSDRISVALLSIIGMISASLGLLLVAFIPDHPSHFDIVWRMWPCALGFAMFYSPNARLIVGSVSARRSASAGSLYTTTRMLGQATSATLVAALLAFELGDGPLPALVAMCLAMVAGVISAVSLRVTKRSVGVAI